MDVLKTISEVGLVPVVALDSAEHAVPLGKALIDGKLPVAEITFRTDAAEESIKRMSAELPGLAVGAGTVLTEDQARRAVAAGARFIVTPGLNPKVVRWCVDNGVPVTPGVNSPSQIEEAMELGLEIVKFFPAEPSGGTAMLKAFAGPYGKMKFIPTGGISLKNLNEYITLPNVFAVGGSWMVAPALYADGDFSKVSKTCLDARVCSLGFELAHIGINGEESEESIRSAQFLSNLLGMPLTVGNSSSFVGKSFEITKQRGAGEHGHIAILANSCERALSFFALQGIAPKAESEKYKNGRLQSVYLDWDFMGFAVHLVRKG